MELTGKDVPKLRDQYFDEAFNSVFSKKFLKCGKEACFRKIRRHFVKDYIKSQKHPQPEWFRILNTIRRSIFENVDQAAHIIFLNQIYKSGIKEENSEIASYKVVFAIISISFFSTYLIQHSSTLKMMLQKGWYEPQVIKENSLIELMTKLLFLTFLGPLQLIALELMTLCMSIAQLISIIVSPNNYSKVQRFFMRFFFQYSEDEVEGIMKQRAIVQLFFEDLPVIVIQILIFIDVLSCPDIRENSQWTLFFSFITSVIEIVFTFADIYFESIALDEPIFNYCLNCLQAKQGWVPFLYQMKRGKVRQYIDFSDIKCTIPGLTQKTAIYKIIKFKFSNISLQNFIQNIVIWNDKNSEDKQQLTTQGLKGSAHGHQNQDSFDLSRKNSDASQTLDHQTVSEDSFDNFVEQLQMATFYTFDIGQSIENVSLNMVLHFYQLTPKERIIIKFTHVDWTQLIKNSRAQNLQVKNPENNKILAKTPAGQNCLWICCDDEYSEYQTVDHEYNEQNQESFQRDKSDFGSSKRLLNINATSPDKTPNSNKFTSGGRLDYRSSNSVSPKKFNRTGLDKQNPGFSIKQRQRRSTMMPMGRNKADQSPRYSVRGRSQGPQGIEQLMNQKSLNNKFGIKRDNSPSKNKKLHLQKQDSSPTRKKSSNERLNLFRKKTGGGTSEFQPVSPLRRQLSRSFSRSSSIRKEKATPLEKQMDSSSFNGSFTGNESSIRKERKREIGEWVLHQCMEEMLDNKFDPNLVDNQGETLVNHVIKTNKLNSLKLLLQHDASSTKKNFKGMSPLGQCIVSQNFEALKIIVQKNCRPFDDQIYDPKISQKSISLSRYFAKLLRLYSFYYNQVNGMLDIITKHYTVKINDQTDSEKKQFFKQFVKVFTTGKDTSLENDEDLDLKKADFDGDDDKFQEYKNARDHLFNERFKVASLLLNKINPTLDILRETDSNGNNLLHHICDNYLPHTIKTLLNESKIKNFTSKTSANESLVIRDLVIQKNLKGVTPIQKALSMVYTEKQIDLVRFLVVRGKLKFNLDLEDAMINHVLDIFKFSDNKKFQEIKEYILQLKDKFENQLEVEQKLLSLALDQKNVQINMRIKEVFEIDIPIEEQIPKMRKHQSKLSTKKNLFHNMPSKAPLVLQKQNTEQYQSSVENSRENTKTNESDDENEHLQFNILPKNYLQVENESIILQSGFSYNAQSIQQLQVQKKSKTLKQGEIMRSKSMTRKATMRRKDSMKFQKMGSQKKLDLNLNQEKPQQSKKNFKEEKNCKLCQTPEAKKVKELTSKFVKDLGSQESHDISNSSCDQSSAQSEAQLKNYQKSKGTQVYKEDIEEVKIRQQIEEEIMSKSSVVKCLKSNIIDITGNQSQEQFVSVPGGHFIQIFYVLFAIKSHYGISYPEYQNYFNARKNHDEVYLSKPRHPREIVNAEHIQKFVMEYIRDIKNSQIELVINKQTQEFLEEQKCPLDKIYKLDVNKIVELKRRITNSNKEQLEHLCIQFSSTSTQLLNPLYEIFIDILIWNEKQELFQEFRKEQFDGKIVLRLMPENLETSLVKGIILLNAPQEIMQDHEMLDDSTSQIEYLIDQEQSSDKVVALSIPDGGFWAINTVAGKAVREDILVHLNRTYEGLFENHEEDLERLLDQANEMANRDLGRLLKKHETIPQIQIPVKIDLSGTYVQHVQDIEDTENSNEFRDLDEMIYTRCILKREDNEMGSIHDFYNITNTQVSRLAQSTMRIRKIKKKRDFNIYLEFMFALILEAIALGDLTGDLVFSFMLFDNQHISWGTLSILSMLSPFFICYVPLLTFQRYLADNSVDQSQQQGYTIKQVLQMSSLSPLILVYLLFMDILYLFFYLIVQFFIIISDVLYFHQKNTRENQQNKFDLMYARMINMSKEDMKGFRRLRTISQFTFESLPQIMIQCYILLKQVYFGEETGLNVRIIILSLSAAMIHAYVEVVFVNLEAKACKTSLIHYFIICFNARFGWVPFADRFSNNTNYKQIQDGENSSQQDGINLDYEDMKASLCGQIYKFDYMFNDHTIETLTACIINQPIEVQQDRITKFLKLGQSLNEISFDNILELITVSHQRINLNIEEVDIKQLLENDKEKIQMLKQPHVQDQESMMERMVSIGQVPMVKIMHEFGAQMDFQPSLYQLAKNNNDFAMIRMLSNLNYEEFQEELSLIQDYECQFQYIIDNEDPEIIATLFTNPQMILSESFQQNVLLKILSIFDQRHDQEAFFLLKAFCGPEIPFYLLKGEGNQPQIDLNSKIETYSKSKAFFNRLIRLFPKQIQFCQTQDDKKVQQISTKSAFYYSEVRMNYLNTLSFERKRYQQESKSTFGSLTDGLSNISQSNQSGDQDDINLDDSQELKPFLLEKYNVETKYVHLIDRILSGGHRGVKLMTTEDTMKCDHAIQVLGLDKHRDRYFARTRFGDLTGSVKKIRITRLKLPDVHDSFENQKIDSMSLVVPESEMKKPIQRVIQVVLNDDVAAVKSFKASYHYFKGKVLLNLVKKMHQTTQIISKQNQVDKWVTENYTEEYDFSQDNLEQNSENQDDFEEEEDESFKTEKLRNPRGYKNLIASAQGGDTILMLFVGSKIKQVEVNMELYTKITNDYH